MKIFKYQFLLILLAFLANIEGHAAAPWHTGVYLSATGAFQYLTVKRSDSRQIKTVDILFQETQTKKSLGSAFGAALGYTKLFGDNRWMWALETSFARQLHTNAVERLQTGVSSYRLKTRFPWSGSVALKLGRMFDKTLAIYLQGSWEATQLRYCVYNKDLASCQANGKKFLYDGYGVGFGAEKAFGKWGHRLGLACKYQAFRRASLCCENSLETWKLEARPQNLQVQLTYTIPLNALNFEPLSKALHRL